MLHQMLRSNSMKSVYYGWLCKRGNSGYILPNTSV